MKVYLLKKEEEAFQVDIYNIMFTSHFIHTIRVLHDSQIYRIESNMQQFSCFTGLGKNYRPILLDDWTAIAIILFSGG